MNGVPVGTQFKMLSPLFLVCLFDFLALLSEHCLSYNPLVVIIMGVMEYIELYSSLSQLRDALRNSISGQR